MDIHDICHPAGPDGTELAAAVAKLGRRETEALIDEALAATVPIRVLYAALHHYLTLAHADSRQPPSAEDQSDPSTTADT